MRQLIIVRKDLEMSAGKMAAQASHASNAFLMYMIKTAGTAHRESLDIDREGWYELSMTIPEDIYDGWFNDIFTKTICEAKNKNQLMKAVTLAEGQGLRENEDFFLIKDNCLTELELEEIEKAVFLPFFKKDRKADAAEEGDDMSDKMDEFYDAWTFLADHPIFIRDSDPVKEPHYFHFQRNLDIEVVKVNPETNAIDEDKSLNTKTAVWLECGIEDGHHDIDLDSGGDNFEEAIIGLAKLVREKYGDIPARND